MDDIRRILTSTRRIAVLGATDKVHKAGYYVPSYLKAVGYEVFPVSPTQAGRELFGRKAVASLADLTDAVDMIDVFRRSELLPDHLEEFLAVTPRPQVIWFQQGIRNDAVASLLAEAGIEVVQDRCTLADHRRYLG
jgi:uncharacterized protein